MERGKRPAGRGGHAAPSSPAGSRAAAGPSLNVHASEKDLIRRALADTDGNITKAAALLGMSRRTLHRKIKVLFPDSAEAIGPA